MNNKELIVPLSKKLKLFWLIHNERPYKRYYNEPLKHKELTIWHELVAYKNTKAIIPYEERAEIVSAIKYVDRVVPQESMDKMAAWEKYHFDVMFVGSDWQGTEKWKKERDIVTVQ